MLKSCLCCLGTVCSLPLLIFFLLGASFFFSSLFLDALSVLGKLTVGDVRCKHFVSGLTLTC